VSHSPLKQSFPECKRGDSRAATGIKHAKAWLKKGCAKKVRTDTLRVAKKTHKPGVSIRATRIQADGVHKMTALSEYLFLGV
jgi:hypothetical protein